MRTIKFRAWDGQLMITPDMSDHSDFFIEPDGTVRKTLIEMSDGGYRSDMVTAIVEGLLIMQFTGLKDMGGVEIYEGDIVEHMPSAFDMKAVFGEIKWFGGHARFFLNGTDGTMHYLDKLKDYRIIGNIHENKDLLK